MDRTTALKGKSSVTIWLTGETVKDRRLIERVINLLADEIRYRIDVEADWDVVPLVEVGAEMMAFLECKTKEAEDAEDAEILGASDEYVSSPVAIVTKEDDADEAL